jgi:hypothetical protein
MQYYNKALQVFSMSAIFIILAQALAVSNLFLGVLDQQAFGDISGNVANLT